ncbi:hypothetical protein [Cytobacillus purgationiresistens]|uniref:N-acetylmuramoyl-L-alanine amidase n=1 Tax=Cytobacillus purgationiresistens TaxID=863449 RepID=A0ABU0AE66_9BACI|nr:hypothetical protein [Cytobacillus purgationiresistens]MDQ0269537.1 N-acetylmuramoyl-L-alanine amidase [Cytobacillus purgationiresistens]
MKEFFLWKSTGVQAVWLLFTYSSKEVMIDGGHGGTDFPFV